MAFFGLKLGLDLEMRAAHPQQKFQEIPHPREHKLERAARLRNKYLSGIDVLHMVSVLPGAYHLVMGSWFCVDVYTFASFTTVVLNMIMPRQRVLDI